MLTSFSTWLELNLFRRYSLFSLRIENGFVCYVFAPVTRDRISDEQRRSESMGQDVYLFTWCPDLDQKIIHLDLISSLIIQTTELMPEFTYWHIFSPVVDKVCVKHLNAKTQPQNTSLFSRPTWISECWCHSVLWNLTPCLGILYGNVCSPSTDLHSWVALPTLPAPQLKGFIDLFRYYQSIQCALVHTASFQSSSSPDKRLGQLFYFYFIWSNYLIFYQTLQYSLLY